MRDAARGWLHRSEIVVLARLGIGLVWIYFAFAKLADPPLFVKSLGGYGMLPTEPPALINGIAIVMPWLELLVGGCLVLGLMPRGAPALACVMLVVFTAAVYLRGRELQLERNLAFTAVEFDCGCGTGNVFLWKKLASNGLMILGSCYLVVTDARAWTLWTLAKSRPAASIDL